MVKRFIKIRNCEFLKPCGGQLMHLAINQNKKSIFFLYIRILTGNLLNYVVRRKDLTKNKDTCKILCKSKVSLFYSRWPQPFPMSMMCHSDSVSTCYRPFLKYSSLQIAVFLDLILLVEYQLVLQIHKIESGAGLQYAIVKLKAINLHSNILAFFL